MSGTFCAHRRKASSEPRPAKSGWHTTGRLAHIWHYHMRKNDEATLSNPCPSMQLTAISRT
eukprot:5554503-Pleurochrysis_carterae.AAC.1